MANSDPEKNPYFFLNEYQSILSLIQKFPELSNLYGVQKINPEKILESIAAELKNSIPLIFERILNSIEVSALDKISKGAKGESLSEYEEHVPYLNQFAEVVRSFSQADLVLLYEISKDGRPKSKPGFAGEFYHIGAMLTEMEQTDVVFKFTKITAPRFIKNAQKNKILNAERDGISRKTDRFVAREKVKSTAIVPIYYTNQKEGLLFINFRGNTEFNEKKLLEYENLFRRLGSILHNIRIYRRQVEYNKQLETLFQVIQTLTEETGDRQIMLDTIIKGAAEIIGVPRGAISVWGKEQKSGEIIAEYRSDPNAISYLGNHIGGQSSLQQIIFKEREKGIVITDVSTDTRISEFDRNRFLRGNIKSTMLMPVFFGNNQILACIGVDETRYCRHFTVEEQRLCRILANQTAIALQLTASLNEIRESIKVTQLQQAIMDEATDNPDPTKIYTKLLDGGINLIKNASEGKLFFIGRDKKNLIATVSTNPLEHGIIHPIEYSIVGLAYTQKETIRVDDIKSYKGSYQPGYSQGMKSELAVPLTNNGEVIGVLNVKSIYKNAFTIDDQILLETLANRVVKVLNLVQTLGELNALSVLNEPLGDVIANQGENLSNSLQAIIDQGQQISKAQMVQILELDDEQKTLTIIHSSVDDVGRKVEVSDSITGIAILEKDLINVKNINEERHPIYGPYKNRHKWFDKTLDLKSELVVPLIFGEKIIGVLNFGSQRVHAFTEQHELWVKRMAIQAAAIIMVARIFELEKEKKELEIKNAHSRDIADIMHQINNPLGLAHQYGKFALNQIDQLGINDPQIRNDLENLLLNTHKISDLVKKFRAELRDIDAFPIDLKAEINQAVTQFNEIYPKHQTKILVDIDNNIPKIQCGAKIGQVLFEIINNAYESQRGNSGKIRIFTQVSDQKVQLFIKDSGIGISKEELHYIFEDWFYSTKGHESSVTQSGPGRGLGLFWARKFLNAYGADITIDSELDVGTTVTISFPILKNRNRW